MQAFIQIVFGLGLLIVGSRGVIKNAIDISKLTKIPPFIIGATIVAIGTSLPEMVISFFGGLEKAQSLALGDVIGSNIVNIGLIFGISILIRPLIIGRKKTQKNMILMFILSIVLFIILFLDGITKLYGFIFVIIGFFVIYWQINQGKKDFKNKMFGEKTNKKPLIIFTFFFISLIILFLGGKFLVDGGVAFANLLNISEATIGVTILAIGTSIPELAISLVALTKKTVEDEESSEKLIVGNILGSNVFNILFGAGILGLFGVKHLNNLFSLFAFLFFTILCSVLINRYSGRKIPQYFGAVFIFLYILYVMFLLI